MSKIVTIILMALISGCSFIPKYNRPSIPVVSGGLLQSTQAIDIGWRRFFLDPKLKEIIELALQNNKDLRIAVLNVEQVQAQYRIGQAQALPMINGVGSTERNHLPSQATSTGKSETNSRYTVGLGISAYELDLFGRIRSLKAQALENYFAMQEVRRNIQLMLVAQVATQYLMVCQLNEQLGLTDQTLESVRKYYGVINKSYELGNASALDLKSVESQVQSALVNAAEYERQLAQAKNELAFLIAGPLPEQFISDQTISSGDFLAYLPPGLPSNLLENRPDILEAEHILKGANANIGAARAAFFPQITLTGFAGEASLKLNDLFSGGVAWNYAPQITMPIFDGGSHKAGLDLAKISKRIEIANYEKTVQNAFREVADALSAETTLFKQLQAQQALVKAQQERYDLADIRYRNGVDSYLTVLTAQQDLYGSKQGLIQTRFKHFFNRIALYKALGGGWEQP